MMSKNKNGYIIHLIRHQTWQISIVHWPNLLSCLMYHRILQSTPCPLQRSSSNSAHDCDSPSFASHYITSHHQLSWTSAPAPLKGTVLFRCFHVVLYCLYARTDSTAAYMSQTIDFCRVHPVDGTDHMVVTSKNSSTVFWFVFMVQYLKHKECELNVQNSWIKVHPLICC